MSHELGAVLPIEIAHSPSEIFTWAKEIESLGFDYIVVYDHVVLKDNQERVLGQASYSINRAFNEPFVLLGALSAITSRVNFFTGVLVLPQRQTVLVAKQAAEVDHLSGGRLRLGVGVGWNEAEYKALGSNFRTRGRRIEQQIDLIRQLWTKDIVTYLGESEKLEQVGLNPQAKQRPIPIWIGGLDSRVIERMARLADGWIFRGKTERFSRLRDILLKHLEHEGRDLGSFGLMGKINVTQDRNKESEYKSWLDYGASHVSFSTTGENLTTADRHLEQLSRVIKELK